LNWVLQFLLITILRETMGCEFDLFFLCCVRFEEILRFPELGFDCNDE
jgi:hypothetical protein